MVEFNPNNVSQHLPNTMTELPPRLSQSSGFFQGAKEAFIRVNGFKELPVELSACFSRMAHLE